MLYHLTARLPSTAGQPNKPLNLFPLSQVFDPHVAKCTQINQLSQERFQMPLLPTTQPGSALHPGREQRASPGA